MADSNGSNDSMDDGSDATTIIEAQYNTVTKGNQRGKVLKRKRGMQKMIIIGTRVSGKYRELVQNPKGPQFRRVRNWVLRNVTKSISNNKYEVKFDNGVVKECSSQALRIEEATSGETRDPYFRLSTTLNGFNVTNAWKLSLHYLLFTKLQKKHNAESLIGIIVLAGMLSIIL